MHGIFLCLPNERNTIFPYLLLALKANAVSVDVEQDWLPHDVGAHWALKVPHHLVLLLLEDGDLGHLVPIFNSFQVPLGSRSNGEALALWLNLTAADCEKLQEHISGKSETKLYNRHKMLFKIEVHSNYLSSNRKY